MNTMQPKKSQITKNEPTQGLCKELSDDVASRYSGGQNTSEPRFWFSLAKRQHCWEDVEGQQTVCESY